MDPSFEPVVAQAPTLFDLLIVQTRASIFGDYLRSDNTLSSRLSSGAAKSTVLVPTNKAVIALARKPHMGPANKTTDSQDEIEISDKDKDRQARINVRNWVGAHIIPQHPISLSSTEEFPTLLEGTSVRFVETKTASGDWEHRVMYPDTKILERIEGSNGVIYLIEGTVTF